MDWLSWSGRGQCIYMVYSFGQVISNDPYKSVLHGAVMNCHKDCISVHTFHCPSPDAVIGQMITQLPIGISLNFGTEDLQLSSA